MRQGLIPGHNVDKVDVAAGLRELAACGYHEAETVMVIDYALNRWKRGEEEAAQRGAIDRDFHGISLICWLRVLAASQVFAMAQVTTTVLKRDYQKVATMRSERKGDE